MKAVAKKQPTKKEPSWKLVFSVFLILLWAGASVIVVQLIVGYIMVSVLGAEKFMGPVWMAIYSALSYILALVSIIFIPPLILQKKRKEKTPLKVASRTDLGLRGMPTWTDIGLAPVGFIVYLLLAAGITAIFSLFPWFNVGEAQEVGFSTYVVGFDRIMAFLTLVVMAPIAEEIIFRGWLYGKLRNKLSQNTSNAVSILLATLLVSILFGVVHMQWNVGVNVFAMSVVLCGLREITGTIYSGILVHMIKNGLAFYYLYILGIA